MGAWYVSECVWGCVRVCSSVCLVRAQCVPSALLINTLALRLQLELEFVRRTAVRKTANTHASFKYYQETPYILGRVHVWALTCVWVCGCVLAYLCGCVLAYLCGCVLAYLASLSGASLSTSSSRISP